MCSESKLGFLGCEVCKKVYKFQKYRETCSSQSTVPLNFYLSNYYDKVPVFILGRRNQGGYDQ